MFNYTAYGRDSDVEQKFVNGNLDVCTYSIINWLINTVYYSLWRQAYLARVGHTNVQENDKNETIIISVNDRF